MANKYSSELLAERAVAVKLLSRGLVTVAEVAKYYGFPRQTIQRWIPDLNVTAARVATVAEIVERETASQAARKAGARKVDKAKRK